MILFSILENERSMAGDKGTVQIDETLFIRIAENDVEAFETLYLLTERALYAFALSILKNHDNALDIVQDTYLKIRSAAHLYKPMGKPMAWIFTIARNLAMTKFRTEKKYANVEIDLEKEPAFSFVTDAEDRIVLQMAFNKLSQQEREIIFLHAVSGYSHREIAENLEMPLSTALSKYHRGLKKLKILLAQKEEVL